MSSEKEKGEYDPNKKYRDFKWEKPDEFKNGPLGDDKRHCRDCLCCIIFVLFLCGCVVVCAMGVKGGDPNLVLYPYDEDGKQCGRDEYKDYKFLYFYNVASNLKSFNTSSVVLSVSRLARINCITKIRMLNMNLIAKQQRIRQIV